MMIFLIKMPKSMCNFLSRVFGLYLWLSRDLFWFRDGLSVGVQRTAEFFLFGFSSSNLKCSGQEIGSKAQFLELVDDVGINMRAQEFPMGDF